MKNIKITVGTPHYGRGQTIVVISNEGQIEARNICHKDIVSYQLALEEDEAKEILSTIVNRLRQIPDSKTRKGVPDEVEYDIEVNAQEGKPAHYRVWDNDISKDKELKQAFRQLREKVWQYSEKKILL